MALDIADRACRSGTSRFLTLTRRGTQLSLEDCIRSVLDAFKKFRKHPKIAPVIDGGVRALEVTRGQNNTHWHVHLHCIISGRFAPQKLLSAVWLEVTGDSQIVDVRALHDRTQAARYIAAYVAKPTKMDAWTKDQLREYAMGIHGVRLVQCWGSWHAAATDTDDLNEPDVPTAHLCSLNRLHAAAEAGSMIAAAVKLRLCCHDFQWRQAMGCHPSPSEIADKKPDEATLLKCYDFLEFLENRVVNDYPSLDADYRGRGPMPQRRETQLVYEFLPQPPADPSPADVDRWERTAAVGFAWET